MNLLQRIAQSLGFGGTDARPQNATYTQDVMDAFGVTPSASSGLAVTPLSAMRVAAVFACVQKIAGAIATLPVHVYETDGDVKKRLPRDDLWYKLNEQPSVLYTAASHWEGVSTGQLLRGDSYTWIRRSMNNTIRELLPLPYGAINPVRQSDGSVRYFLSLPDYGISTWLDGADLLHFPGFGFDGIKSMSVISYAARNAVGNALAMDDYSGKFFANGAHPSMVLSAPGKMTPEQISNLQAAFAGKYAGLDNAHRVTLTAQDAQLLEARKFQVIDIARAFGVPPHMIGETSASTSWGSGIESMSRGFVTYTLQPHLVRIEQELNRKLFPRSTGRFVQFDRDALIEGDSAAQAAYNRAALGGPGTGMGWMSVDEVRKAKGMAPVGGTASEVFDPRSLQPQPDPGAEQAATDAAAKNLIDMRNIANEAQKPTIVNVAAPVVNVTVPEQPAPQVHTVVNVPESVINVEAVMPQQDAPVVNLGDTVVHLPEVAPVAAPIVNVAAPIVNVEAPTVHNNTIVNTPDSINMAITSMPERVTSSTVTRDKDGNIVRATNTEKDI